MDLHNTALARKNQQSSVVSQSESPRRPLEDFDNRPKSFSVSDSADRRISGSYVHSRCKRAFDVIVASTLLVLAFPVLCIVALLVKLSSPGPVIFKQKRTGYDGFFNIYKFRSMYFEPENTASSFLKQAVRGDSRVTLVGYWLRRTSLDELPQLINVLQGKMSIIGPRPHALSHDKYYAKHITNYMLRYECRPGITGLAQVSGSRGETATHDDMLRRVTLDLEYIERSSLMSDCKIILRTAWMMIDSKSVY